MKFILLFIGLLLISNCHAKKEEAKKSEAKVEQKSPEPVQVEQVFIEDEGDSESDESSEEGKF